MLFLRTRGERAQVIVWPPSLSSSSDNDDKSSNQSSDDDDDNDDDDDDEPPLPPIDVYQHLKHGDIIYNPNGYRATTTFVVVAATAAAAALSQQQQQQDDSNTTSATAAAAAAATANVVNVERTDDDTMCVIRKHVSNKIEDPVDFYSQVVTANTFYGGVNIILLDVEKHQKLLSAQAGRRRPIHSSRMVRYCCDNNRYEIDTPNGGTATLNSNTPDEYLWNTI